jgi:formyltetrahydrofolate deformylase
MNAATLRIQCDDAKGLVYRVSKFVFERGGNIVDSQQHTEQLANRFFMRVVFDREGMALSPGELRADLARLAAELNIQAELTFGEERKRLAIMVSKYDHCLYDLLLRHRYGEIPADIALVVGNHPDLAPVVENFGVPFHHVPVEKGHKTDAEARALELFREQGVSLVVLARYMQILTPVLLEAFPMRIINVHHGFLPAFKGAKPYHQAYEYGVKLIGATSHYATDDLDMGPIIAQETIRVDHTRSVEDLVAMGRDVEKQVLAAAVKAHVADKIMVFRNRTIVFR